MQTNKKQIIVNIVEEISKRQQNGLKKRRPKNTGICYLSKTIKLKYTDQ